MIQPDSVMAFNVGTRLGTTATWPTSAASTRHEDAADPQCGQFIAAVALASAWSRVRPDRL